MCYESRGFKIGEKMGNVKNEKLFGRNSSKSFDDHSNQNYSLRRSILYFHHNIDSLY